MSRAITGNAGALSANRVRYRHVKARVTSNHTGNTQFTRETIFHGNPYGNVDVSAHRSAVSQSPKFAAEKKERRKIVRQISEMFPQFCRVSRYLSFNLSRNNFDILVNLDVNMDLRGPTYIRVPLPVPLRGDPNDRTPLHTSPANWIRQSRVCLRRRRPFAV